METVISCEKTKDWINKKGEKVPIYSVGLSDGRGGQSFGKAIPINTPVSELEITDKGNFGLDFKMKGASNSFGGGGKRGGNESFALAYAKDLVVGGKTDLKNILPLADKLYAWLEGKKVSAPFVAASTLPAAVLYTPATAQANAPHNSTDDLPF